MPSQPDPEIKALLLCDQVIQEAGTNKHSAIGVFTTITALRVPVVHPRLGILVRMVNAEGVYDLSVSLVHVDTQEEVARIEGLKVDVKSVHEIVDFGMNTQQLLLPRFGAYDVNLNVNRRLRQNAGFTLRQLAPPPPPGGQQ